MKRILLMAVMAIAVTAVSAQGFGLRGGVNLSNFAGDDASDDAKMLTGFHIGLDYEIAVAPDFYFAPGLLFSTKGSKEEYSEEIFGVEINEESKTILNYLEVPLNLVYKPLLGEGNLIVAFGPYLGYGIGGKNKWEVSGGGESESGESDITFGSGDDEIKAFDMGANISFGYMFAGGLSVQLNTQLGLVSIVNNDASVKNTGFGLGLGYRF